MTELGQPWENNVFAEAAGFAAPEPYPPIKVVGTNQYYARILQEDIGGKISEMSAVSQYTYHFMVLAPPELTDLLKGISMVEMRHLELLGKTVTALGGEPRYQGYNGRYWSSDLIYCGVDVVDRITADIASEKQAIQQYRYHQSLINDPGVCKLLDRIIKDELYHITLLQNALRLYAGKEKN